MSRQTNLSQRPVIFLPLIISCALTVLACLLLYTFDNKYHAAGPAAQNGCLMLNAGELERYPTVFLVEGWEYYGGRLLSPEDFGAVAAPVPDAYIYIGQYGGFELDDLAASPHGSASYRLVIEITGPPASYTLELPEIFSSYRLYINGREVKSMGNPDPDAYRPETGNRTVTIDARDRVEILFAVSDFSYFYSGMIYPPVFGQPDAVASLLNSRLIFRSVFAAFALAVGILSVLIGLLSRKSALAVLYGLLCLCFVGYTSYPILRTLISGFFGLYTLEYFSFSAMLAVIMLILRLLFGLRDRWGHCFIVFGGSMCLFSLLLPFVIPGGNLAVMALYSVLISIYEIAMALYIAVTAVRSLLRGLAHSPVLLCGFAVFDVSLLMDRILPLHEPIVTGWFPEFASFALILCVGIAVGQEMAGKYRQSAVLSERQTALERLSRLQRTNYELLMDRVEEAKAARHNLRHHLIAVDGFLKNREYEKLGVYVADLHSSLSLDEPMVFTDNIVVDVLLQHYARIAAQRKIPLHIRPEIGPETGIPDHDLCAVLGNLLENAVESCERSTATGRFISLSIIQQGNALSVRMENSSDQSAQKEGSRFLSSKSAGRMGYGLQSIEQTAERLGGVADFSYDESAGIFTSSVILLGEKNGSL